MADIGRARKRLGILTPSSNTVLEPISFWLTAGMPDVSLHFSRLRVKEISMSATGCEQFAVRNMVEAARLLSDAKVDGITWSGTSAAWLGLERDRAFCRAVFEETGIPSTTATLSAVEALHARGIHRIGLATPYVSAIQRKIVETLEKEGIEVVVERHLDLTDNFSFAEVAVDQILDMARQAGASGPDAILILCTNLRGAPLVERIERELQTPVLDSVVLGLLGGLRSMSVDFSHIRHAGRVCGWTW